MREIHYIDIDEEIISAVGRLRKSGQGENVFIFPKRALILQSIVNLRLLEREAKKLGKQIIVVSQDEAGRKLAEKAGLTVEEYQDQALQEAQAKETARFTVEHTTGAIPLPEKNAIRESRQRVSDIGSDNFFSAAAPISIVPLKVNPPQVLESSPSLPVSMDATKKLRVRDVSPATLTTLNSKRTDSMSGAPRTSFVREESHALPQSRPEYPVRENYPMPLSAPEAVLKKPPEDTHSEKRHFGKLARFMGATEKTGAPVRTPLTPSQTTPPLPHYESTSHFSWSWIVLGMVVLVGGVGMALFVLFPKATVTIEPQTAEQVIRFQGTAALEGGNGTDTFTGRIATLERTVRLTEEATGTATSDQAKARGKIKIYNDFSKDPQSLVATTRFETKEGKIFRLLEGVTVPGVNETGGKRERGMVEATVVADQIGAEYNIGATTFTIPGFKGGPKYEKFTAESTQAFVGGGNGTTPSGERVVSGDDINRAKAKALAEAKQMVLTELRSTLASGEAILEDSLAFTERPGTIAPPLGSTQPSFVYEARFETKLFIINEAMVKERIAKERVTAGGVTLLPHTYDVRYTALLPKYDTGRIDMTVESTVLFQAALDEEKMKTVLLGQDEAGIRTFLENHPEVERLQVEFHPQLLVSTIPNQASRVMIDIVSSEETQD